MTSRRRLGLVLRAVIATSLCALTMPVSNAYAYHDGLHLEITPEVQRAIPVGSTATLTAVLVGSERFSPFATSDTEVDFENEGGAGDFDGVSLNTPDYSCVVPAGSSMCSVEIEATRAGTALFRAWIDTDGTATHNADAQEGRFAGSADCNQSGDVRADCSVTGNSQAPIPGGSCPAAPSAIPQIPGSEPDCTDVVEITFVENAAGTLDCDDSTGPDTEHETNPSGANGPTGNHSNEVYTCQVRDEFGNLKGDVDVHGEVISGPNDKDNGASFTSADYSCRTFKENDLVDETKRKGQCPITVTQATTPQIGTTTICFWVGTMSDGIDLCQTELVDKGTNRDGSDQGDNNADLVEITWENVSDLVLDCNPEAGFSLVNSVGSFDCKALSQVSDRGVEGITIRAEAAGANDPDDSDSPQTQDAQPTRTSTGVEPNPLSCTTAADGKCSIKHTGEDAGETIYRVWIDDGDTETTGATMTPAPDYDAAEGQDERKVPGATGEPDATDVVISDWGEGPTRLVASPKSATSSVGRCHEVTLTATDKDGNPAGGVRLDVEQKHERFSNMTPSDEPIVDFCTPVAGPNPSEVDTSLGDLRGSGGSQNTSGNAGGETVGTTDAQGLITIGVEVEPAHGSNGEGSVSVVSWWETVDNDDPSGGEPSDVALVTWEYSKTTSASLELTPDNATAGPGDEIAYTATIIENGLPVPGVEISWSSTGTGSFTWSDTTTNQQGQATAYVSSPERGSMTVTATCAGQYTCSDSSTQKWGPAICDVMGTEGADVITGTDAPETICGFGGDDAIDGGGGDDILIGSDGNDRLVGGQGNDEILGGAHNDILKGGSGDDRLAGGAGLDRLFGMAGNDRLLGGVDDDKLYGGGGGDTLIGGPGKDFLDGQGGRNSCREESARSPASRC